MFNIPIIVIYCFMMNSCASTQTTSSSSGSSTQGSGYSEDLSVVRPKVEVRQEVKPVQPAEDRKATPYIEPKYSVNGKVDAVLDSIDRLNAARRFVEGFTIQVYSGLKREDALSAKKQLVSSLPSVESEMLFAQPNFKVKVGKYYDRMSAQKDFAQVKRLFPSAIIIPEKIALN